MARQTTATEQLRQEVKNLQAITKQRMQEMLTLLVPPADETTTFELLDEDDF